MEPSGVGVMIRKYLSPHVYTSNADFDLYFVYKNNQNISYVQKIVTFSAK
jgi:hypothetical protein